MILFRFARNVDTHKVIVKVNFKIATCFDLTANFKFNV